MLLTIVKEKATTLSEQLIDINNIAYKVQNMSKH